MSWNSIIIHFINYLCGIPVQFRRKTSQCRSLDRQFDTGNAATWLHSPIYHYCANYIQLGRGLHEYMSTGGVARMGREIRPPWATESKRRQNGRQIEYFIFKKMGDFRLPPCKWNIHSLGMLRSVIGNYRRFGTTYRSIFEGPDRSSRNVCSLTANLPRSTSHVSRDLEKIYG